jgi:hypothetical protein
MLQIEILTGVMVALITYSTVTIVVNTTSKDSAGIAKILAWFMTITIDLTLYFIAPRVTNVYSLVSK